jgi:hypothetical protein
VNDIIDYSEKGQVEMGTSQIMMEYEGGKWVAVTGPIADAVAKYGYQGYNSGDSDNDPKDEPMYIDWVTDLTKLTVAKTTYIVMGTSLQCILWVTTCPWGTYSFSSFLQSSDVWACLPSHAYWPLQR